MALSRTTLLLLLLPAPAAVYLATSMEDVNANSQCLPSARAVLQQYPGSWASWTTRAANHKGEKCWYPVMRENHSRHVEAALHRTAQKLLHVGGDKDASTAGRKAVPVVLTSERKELGWGLPNGSAGEAQSAESSFEDRFSASRETTSVQKPSVIQRMMDPVGAVPDLP